MKLLKIIGLLGLTIFLQGCLSSKNVLISKQENIVTENSLLWAISGNGLETPSYIYGTIHLISQKDFEIPDTLNTLISNCEQITFEVNMDEMSNENNILSILMKSVMENGTTLKDLLTDEEYEKIEVRFDEIGLPLYMVERIKPMILSVMLSSDLSASNEAMASYEMRILQMTKKMNKKMNGLESLDFQMSMFDSIPYPVQAKMMMSSIDEASHSDEFDEMVKMYKNQNIDKMSKMVILNDVFRPYEDLLIKDRNTTWIPVMKTQMSDKQTLFAVGAGHLGGEFGLISLLQKEGYKVQPIYFLFSKTVDENGVN